MRCLFNTSYRRKPVSKEPQGTLVSGFRRKDAEWRRRLGEQLFTHDLVSVIQRHYN